MAYREKMQAVEWDNFQQIEDLWAQFLEFARTQPQPAIRGVELGSSTGDFINNCENAQRCFDSRGLRDCVNCLGIDTANDCMDYFSWGQNVELIYCTTRCGYNSTNVKFCFLTYESCADVEYCITCFSCKNCFGCVGLRHKEYCILNTQYSRDEYLDLRKRIVAQMSDPQATPAEYAYGEYFPYSLSCFPFNDSDAMYYCPLSKEEALQRGANWYDDPTGPVRPSLDWAAVAQRTKEVTSSICDETLACQSTGKLMRITKLELEMYKRRNIPLPRINWESRLLRRFNFYNYPQLYESVCPKSGRQVTTTFAPNSPWLVWHNSAYTEQFG